MPTPEATLTPARHVLILLSAGDSFDNFAGRVVTDLTTVPDLTGCTVYLSGDLSRASQLDLSAASRVRVVSEHPIDGWTCVKADRLPRAVHGLGVYFPAFFAVDAGYFERVVGEHDFQTLTESTKPGRAHRTGLYLTPVRPDGAALRFRLLRCSTNLSGPTANFRATDHHIVNALNLEAEQLFDGAAPLNHVLAQIYHNTPANPTHKQVKARISPHADKTKDMPPAGIMAFCTFYARSDRDPTVGLTRLRFRAKTPGAAPAEFTLTLHPGSVFFMPLSTNRLYTHEIVPSEIDAARLPTRLGYVVRCSSAEALHQDGQTFLDTPRGRLPLEPPSPEGMHELRTLYAEENKTTAHVHYGDHLRFSMNTGDYLAPTYAPEDLFRTYTLSLPADAFTALCASAELDDLGRGRRGAVLVAADPRGVPLVRTTTRTTRPAQCFGPLHTALAQQIQAAASLRSGFNNLLFEAYTAAYARMGAHSDQALDLDEDADIAVFSCYQNAAVSTRRLLVEDKLPGGPGFSIPLLHHTVVLFSAETNRRFRHRIVLEPGAPDNLWLGLTFRRSKTFVRFADGTPCLPDCTPLRLANEDEQRSFFQLRHRENHEVDFAYPPISFTLSEPDLWPPVPSRSGLARA